MEVVGAERLGNDVAVAGMTCGGPAAADSFLRILLARAPFALLSCAAKLVAILLRCTSSREGKLVMLVPAGTA